MVIKLGSVVKNEAMGLEGVVLAIRLNNRIYVETKDGLLEWNRADCIIKKNSKKINRKNYQ